MLGTFLPRPQQQPQEQQEQPQEQQRQQQPQLQQQPQEHQQQQQPQLQQQPQQGEEYQIVIHPRRKYNKEVKLLGGKVLARPAGLGLLPCREEAKAIKKAIRAVYKKCYPTYAKLIEDEDVKKEIFEVFSGLCTWEPHLHDDVESSFHHTAADRLKDLLHDAREAYEVTGRGTKKNKYGFGKLAPNVTYENLLHVPTPEERCRPTTFPPEAQAEIQRLTQELQAHREELNRRAQQEQQIQDRLDRLDREVEERRAMINEQFRIEMDEHRRQMDEQRRQLDEYFRQMASSKNAPNDQTNSTDDEASNESDSEDADD
ncbi:uridine/cytidine kinase [Trifolium repens]|nr:uridine/cytidine kinase [Trifolium repens]